jgi:hypothetical protein
MSQTLYTIIVTLVDGRSHTFENIAEHHAEKFKQVVWVRGVTIPINNMTKEQVSPYRITTVILTKQVAFIPQKGK